MPTNIPFWQVTAAIQPSRETKQWFCDTNIDILDFPAQSPDQKPTDNFLRILARRVYHNKQQFSGVPDLKTAICKE